MIYVPDWETIAEGATRIASATGVSESEAKFGLCGAIADKKILIRATVANGEYYGGRTFEGPDQIEIPLRLKPADIDWTTSRPKASWEVGRYRNEIDWEPRLIALVEVSTRDVIAIFRPLASGANSAVRAPKPQTGKYLLVMDRLAHLYPGGVPEPARVPRQALIQNLLDTTPGLGKTLDPATLKKAITAHNKSKQKQEG
jgi:hypothetical protein